MEALIALVIGVLTAGGVFLALRGTTFPVVLGLTLLSYAVNLFLFIMGRLAIGVPPGHFIGLMVAIRIVENLSHVNARLSFGWLGERLLVSPRYHRWHHAVDLPDGRKYRHGCNFAILFPIWDRLFGTQYMGAGLPPTGVHSPLLASPEHADHFWAQQKDGMAGLIKALRSKLWPERR